ncbi:MAG: leucyl/phenylalanyl-tRNA--protein transferase [Halioglobus sp.]|nr:leucyl/phenylalanyl-tRNA--protein transferase [Halioglobus sp.]
MPSIPQLHEGSAFPPTAQALQWPNGLLAMGGGLSCARLLDAYSRGIFPWYEAPQPVLWWTPDPRSVLFPDALHISRSLRKTLRSNRFRLAVDSHFGAVMRACADVRRDTVGTWIDEDMVTAYEELHALGFAHAVEVFDDNGALVGGLYGVSLGRVFFGESMFSRATDASKVALVALVDIAKRGDIQLIDCQVENPHLNSLGATNINRLDFEQCLEQNVSVAIERDIWHLPATCGDLL